MPARDLVPVQLAAQDTTARRQLNSSAQYNQAILRFEQHPTPTAVLLSMIDLRSWNNREGCAGHMTKSVDASRRESVAVTHPSADQVPYSWAAALSGVLIQSQFGFAVPGRNPVDRGSRRVTYDVR